MSLKNVDIESAMRRLADRRIEEAMREGKFDNLPGAGKPLDLEPMPADESARMMWWALRIMKNQNFTPDEVKWRKQIDGLRDQLDAVTTEANVVTLVNAINRLVKQINTLGTNALNTAVAPVSLEVEQHRLRERLARKAEEDARPRPPSGGGSTVPAKAGVWRCANAQCQGENPRSARFCRRCGRVFGK